jgi:hypothetical protein
MRLQLSALLTALLLTVLAADLRHAHLTSQSSSSFQASSMGQLGPNSDINHRGSGRLEQDNRGSGRIEIAYRGSGRIETAYRGSGRIETAYRGSGRIETAYRGSGRIEVA